jgi:hypothetical protein
MTMVNVEKLEKVNVACANGNFNGDILDMLPGCQRGLILRMGHRWERNPGRTVYPVRFEAAEQSPLTPVGGVAARPAKEA